MGHSTGVQGQMNASLNNFFLQSVRLFDLETTVEFYQRAEGKRRLPRMMCFSEKMHSLKAQNNLAPCFLVKKFIGG